MTAPIHLLMIEDDAEYRRLIERWLAAVPAPRFELTFADRLDEAWHGMERCDLIVLDLGLPDAAGLDTVVAARELAGETPIVVLTAQDDPELGRRALRAGADAFASKGRMDARRLRATLEAALADGPDVAPPPRRLSDDNAREALPGLDDADARPREPAERSGDDPHGFWIDARYAVRRPLRA